MLTVGSLFSGIGGFDLGLERAGMRVLWQCEANEFCRDVLRQHWPAVPCYDDVRAVDSRAPRVDVLCGGFPCQPLSFAGLGLAQDDERWLWPEYARVVRELRPRYVLVENVPALLHRGMGDVLGDLAALGYDAEWDCIPAAALGAPHLRDRVWIVAYPNPDAWRQQECRQQDGGETGPGQPASHRHNAHGLREAVADASGAGLEGHGERPLRAGAATRGGERAGLANADKIGRDGRPRVFGAGWGRELADSRGWEPEPDVGRVATGIPRRVDRIAALGNALIPRIPELLGRRILQWEAA